MGVAAYNGHLEALKLLRDRGGDITHKIGKEEFDLSYLAAKGGHVEILQYLNSERLVNPQPQYQSVFRS
eukprot:CAMPEP_0170563556 /NCGR_PEP_ID=MMETSP0211-20121228/67398_1 /TAXON_ID=311385 /ORGANISM="Pseudokeronopsis sp., Strain OXSARD2" /LENGTH=68 /DNA_ID=CAMNT_0010881937 /DNA_START=1 /DNA_END=203 /DNA_ORIENTATION=+